MKKSILVVAVAAIALSLGACAANEGGTNPTNTDPSQPETPALIGTIDAGGASSMTAAMEAWRAGFQNANTGVTVNYDPTGSGTGRQNFTDGGYVFAGTDAAFAVDKVAGPFAPCAPDSALVQVPVYISPIAIGFKLTGIESLNLDADTIAKIFTGAITTWNDPAIAAQNSGVNLPATAVTPVHRSDQSGTTENFTDYLSKAAPSVWTWEAAQTWPESLTGEAAEKTQGVRETITATEGAVGYLDASQATSMGTVAVKVGSGYVSYSADAAAAAVGKSPLQSGRAASDVVIALDRTLTDANVYPVVLVSYIAACGTYADANDGELVSAFLTYVVSADGQAAAAANAGSAPITGDASLAAKVSAAVSTIS
ncbi:MAG: phosphate ABC transporter substrate-binding protein PstS [Propionibacteriaceae bacterium]|nr:phosphate ABC transporter substrate-binding protein PstS [Propionibacteriaceae bacterium]